MVRDTFPIEYAAESFRILSILVKTFSELLINHQCFDSELLEQTTNMNSMVMADRQYVSIPCTCSSCGRKGFDRLGEPNMCMYCGKEIRFNIKVEQVDWILGTIDESKLFGYTVKPTDITNDEKFTSVASKSFTAPCTYYVASGGTGTSTFRSIDDDKVAQNVKIRDAQKIVSDHQQQISQINKKMLSLWEVITDTNEKAGSNLLKSFLTIDENKLQHAYDALYSKTVCEKCKTEQWPGTLFPTQCSVCAELLPVKLLPGLLVMQKEGALPPAQITAKERKIEYLYTLFEAVFQCAEAAFGLTLDDLARVISEKAQNVTPGEG